MQDREDVTRVSHEVSKTGLSSSEMSETVAYIFYLPNIKCIYVGPLLACGYMGRIYILKRIFAR